MRQGPTSARPIRFSADRLPEESRAHAPVIELDRWNPTRTDIPCAEDVDGSPAPDADDLVYEIDDRGRLASVSLAWNRFAIANGASDLRAENVVGRPFWSFFEDSDGLIEEHKAMQDRCRARDQQGTFLLRCDAPQERRMLRMWIEPLERGRFRYTSRTIAVESLDPELYCRLLGVTEPVRVARCSHCNRFRLENEWFEPEIAVRRDWERYRPGHERAMVHTLCPGCREQLRAVPRLVANH